MKVDADGQYTIQKEFEQFGDVIIACINQRQVGDLVPVKVNSGGPVIGNFPIVRTSSREEFFQRKTPPMHSSRLLYYYAIVGE